MTTAATDRVTIVAPGQTYVGKQGITYGAGASAETCMFRSRSESAEATP